MKEASSYPYSMGDGVVSPVAFPDGHFKPLCARLPDAMEVLRNNPDSVMGYTPPPPIREFDSGATRDQDVNKLDYRGFLSSRALRIFCEYMHKHRVQSDGSLRASDNWKAGIPIDSYVQSLARHVFEFLEAVERGDMNQADELAPAIWFNVQGYIHERDKVKDA